MRIETIEHIQKLINEHIRLLATHEKNLADELDKRNPDYNRVDYLKAIIVKKQKNLVNAKKRLEIVDLRNHGLKRCSTCKAVKSIKDEFYYCKREKRPYANCKTCHKGTVVNWYTSHPDKHSGYCESYTERHREEICQKNHERYVKKYKNDEAFRERQREYQRDRARRMREEQQTKGE